MPHFSRSSAAAARLPHCATAALSCYAMLRSYARQGSQNYASSLREQIGGRPPYPGRAFARRQISRSLMLLRDRTGSKRRADLCRANRRAAAAFRSLVLQRDTEDVLPRRFLRNARRNDEAKIDIDRPSPTESTRLPCTGKIPPRRHASAGCIPASADTCKVRYLTRRFVVSSTKRSSSASRVFMFW